MVDFSLPKGPGAQGPWGMEGLRRVSKGSSEWSDGFFLQPLQRGLLGAPPASSSSPHPVFAQDAQGT